VQTSPTPRSSGSSTTDRFAVAYLSGLVALGVSAAIWVAVVYLVGSAPFWPFLTFIGVMAIIGFALRTNLLLNLITSAGRLAKGLWSIMW
jgi:hypothetical protein